MRTQTSAMYVNLKDDDDKSLPVYVTSTDGHNICINAEGYSDHGSDDDNGTPIVIDFYDGCLRVSVWSDINQEDPTHVIRLDKAKTSNRQPSENNYCHDCGVNPGEAHKDGCDVARCMNCGHQRLSCGCDDQGPDDIWTGIWPGVTACREFDLWCVEPPTHRTQRAPCSKDTPGATEDLNRLHRVCEWDKTQRRWVKKGD